MKGMSIIVKTVSHWLSAFIFLYGLHIVFYGHITPGGGFAGGVIVACMFVLLMLAFGRDQATKWFSHKMASKLDSVGALLFLAIALAGLAFGGFFVNFVQQKIPGEPLRLFNSGIIPMANVAIAIKVAASLFLMALILSALRVVGGGSDSDFTGEEEEQ